MFINRISVFIKDKSSFHLHRANIHYDFKKHFIMYIKFMPQDEIQVFLYEKGSTRHQQYQKTISSGITVTM
jgi:hypothetical protein